ncbi:MAG: VOC family protein [Methanomicrobiales archaeon]|nr:VOC family protein [Methanomicrobiales archaeon]
MPTIVHIDVPADDVARARKFYGDLLGWTFEQPFASMEYYLFATKALDGSPGVGGGMGKRGAPGQRMSCYFGVASIDEYLEKAVSLGASIVMPKMPVPGFGYLASLVDTEGNPFGLWQEDPKAR